MSTGNVASALQRLNALGYGREGYGLSLNLVHNPQGPLLPPAETQIQANLNCIE
jgi:hypothetical protein